MKIIKRNGREVPFDDTKIKAAIEAANSEVEEVKVVPFEIHNTKITTG